MEMIKICTVPSIIMHSRDQLYCVNYSVGEISKEMWEDIKVFQVYNKTEVGKAEIKATADHIGDIMRGADVDSYSPELSRLIDRAGGTVWQIDALVKQDNSDSQYVRMIAFLNEVFLYEWNEDYDKMAKTLELKAKELNAELD